MTDQLQSGSPKSVTADDVAAMAGVSRWTVARAFKKAGSISAKSRKRVMEAAETLGYVPDLSAASLGSDRSNLVALLVDDFDNPHKLVMLERLTRILREAGYGTLLVNMLGEKDAPEALLTASQRRVDAAVLIGTQFDEGIRRTALGARRVKKLIVFARMSPSPDTVSIGCDDVTAMEEVTRHVLARGYRRPMYLAGPDTESTRLFRKETFLRVWSAEHPGSVPAVIHARSYSLADGRDCALAFLRRLSRDTRPDVILCENDVLAMGAMDAIRADLKLRVPQDIAVTGFDDIPLAASPAYDLTTYRQPITEMAQALVRVLGTDGTAQGTILPGRFVIRGSA
ncbi:MAG: LacI family transcriptional regulator [Alphaproteobacteria bacterium HGW-Alphaproteobacteria-6]|nr:MAG: LacI family transcriptional regulator [Alphaproteobacteria bacterium HGW-Alphaproteobacteria-6]